MDIVHKYVPPEISDYETVRSCYFEFPKISFDYEVAEKRWIREGDEVCKQDVPNG